LVGAAFPWLVLVPLLVGASHGLAPGLVSALLLGAGASAHAVRFDALTPDLASWSAGCLSAGAIAGYFCDAARRRRWLLDERANGLALQLEHAQRARRLLELSHARLEQRTAAPLSSLDAALEHAEQRMARLSTGAELAQALLEMLAGQGIVQAATLYRVLDTDRLSPNPIAQLGDARVGSRPHPLVQRVLATGRCASGADPEVLGAAAAQDWSVVAALPLATASARLVGVVAVHQMPFWGLAPEQLRNTLLLASYLADLMEDRLKTLDAQRSALTLPRLRPPPPLGGARAPQLPTFQLAAHGGSLARLGQSLKAPKSRPDPNSA
jgi:polysaccharide biosynthesis protein PelD